MSSTRTRISLAAVSSAMMFPLLAVADDDSEGFFALAGIVQASQAWVEVDA